MPQQINEIKKRLQSVQSTQKLTNATGLVASVKMQKYRRKMKESLEYTKTIEKFLSYALSVDDKNVYETNEYLMEKHSNKKLHIVITSDSGLCGSYNNELLNFVNSNIPKTDLFYVIGEKGHEYLTKYGFNVKRSFIGLPDVEVGSLDNVIEEVSKMFKKDEISEVDIIFEDFINTITFDPTVKRLFPFKKAFENDEKDILLEPDQDHLLRVLIPMYISSTVYESLFKAKTAEFASRKNAMDAANKNADELVETLRLSFNKARQQAITQEMSEIISASEK